MDITVDTKDFVDKMNADYKEYNDAYLKLVTLYQKKQEEYTAYIKKEFDKITDGSDIGGLKQAPYLPHWDGKRYQEIISALGANTTASIVMSTNEYNQAREAIREAILNTGTAFAGMVAKGY